MKKNGVFIFVTCFILAGLAAWMMLAGGDDGESARQAAEPAQSAARDFQAISAGSGVANSRSAVGSEGFAKKDGGEGLAADDEERASVGRGESGVVPTGTEARPAPQPARAASSGVDTRRSAADASDKSESDGPGLDRKVIQEAMDSYKPVVKRCYEALLEDFPDASGTVTIAFDIITEEGEGRIELAELADADDVGVQTDLFDTRLHDCMLANLSDLTFPAPRGGEKIRVNYPFRLRAEARADRP